MTCLNTKTMGIDIIDELIKQAKYMRIGFKSMAIPRGIAPLSSITGTMDKNISLIYSNPKFLHYFVIFDFILTYRSFSEASSCSVLLIF